MPGYWINGGTLAGTLDFYRVVVINDEEKNGAFSRPAQNFNYQQRCCTDYRTARGFSGWWWGGGAFLDPAGTNGMDPIWGNDNLDNAYTSWEPWSLGNKGYTRPFYINGTVFDVNGNPVAEATIKSYVTATGVVDGSTTSNADGTYQVPCYNRTATHYTTAYKSGSPDVAGESVNTLTPSV